MKIPKFWAKAEGIQKSPTGKSIPFSCWRWSDSSQADAEQSALAAGERIREAIAAGRKSDRYLYGTTPLREEVLQTVADPQGNVLAAVTRNVYGSVILNASRVMFVDMDFPKAGAEAGEAPASFFARLFGGGKKKSLDSEYEEYEQKTRAAVEEFVAGRPGWNVRLYRTFGGLRGIVTHQLFDPASSQTEEILQELGADPLFIRLCKLQECFRARLTPKPWRCGHYANTIRYPIEDLSLAKRYQQWLEEYERRQRAYATCRWLGQVGSGRIHPDADLVVKLHDFVTHSQAPFPLA